VPEFPSNRCPLTEEGKMEFGHERLDVHQTALDFLEFTDLLVASLPRGRVGLSDQLSRASWSILANIAEGAGKTSPADKRRHYTIARGSALNRLHCSTPVIG
jgi:hypothetical protein